MQSTSWYGKLNAIGSPVTLEWSGLVYTPELESEQQEGEPLLIMGQSVQH